MRPSVALFAFSRAFAQASLLDWTRIGRLFEAKFAARGNDAELSGLSLAC
jgi:hypothetical protein